MRDNTFIVIELTQLLYCSMLKLAQSWQLQTKLYIHGFAKHSVTELIGPAYVISHMQILYIFNENRKIDINVRVKVDLTYYVRSYLR